MNARQKAKKYKRELEELKKLKPPIQIEKKRCDVRTLATVMTVHLDSEITAPPDEYYARQLLRQLAESDEFKQAVRFDVDVVDRYVGYPRRMTKTYRAMVDILVD